uniref:Uncharacterized protein n=1 Tax=Oryza meridionalis TaxID=40149 RepID=A0A0E0CAS6_9ORYZ
MEGNCGDKSRATIKMHENDEVIASLELSPVEIDMCDEDEEEQSQDTESSSEDEDDCFYPTNKDTSSDDEIMELFYHENTAESTFDTAESRDSVKYSHNRRPYSSIINLCLWPKELFASVAVFETDGKGNCTWQSFWRFNLEIDSIANENSHDATGPLVVSTKFTLCY